MRVLCFNSLVAAGHVGGRAHLFLLERAGFDVVLLPTVLFSNHPAHGGFAGEAVETDRLAGLLEAQHRHGLLDPLDAVVTGYMGRAETARLAARAWAERREGERRPQLICDPVLGDNGALYVPEEVARAIADDLVPCADLLTPNRFEALWLTGATTVEAALASLPAPTVVISSAREATDEIVTLYRDGDEDGEIVTRRHPAAPHGTGDALSALLAIALLRGDTLAGALAAALAILERLIAADPTAMELNLPALAARLDAAPDGG